MESCVACNQQIRVNFLRSSRTVDSFHIVITHHGFADGMVSDEGMTNRPSILAYLVFGPGGITVEGIARPMKIVA
jgi:hypothetical protein